jgi:hypothetical protein
LEHLVACSPSWTIAKSLIPRSIPSILSPVAWLLLSSSSSVIEAKYLSVGVLLIVTVFIFPSIGRWNTALTTPILGMFK